MKTKCPHCNQVWIIEADEQGQIIECFHCKTQFKAAPYSNPVPNEPPQIPFQPTQAEQSVENIDSPGKIWYVIGALVGVIGILFGVFTITQGGLPILIGTAWFWLVATAVGGVLNRLERIAYHTERLREEIKTKAS